jgi:hypothetical protein
MVNLFQSARACLAVGAFVVMSQLAEPALADNLCSRGWHAQAEKTAELGLRLLHSPRAADRVRLWRMIELGEDVPSGSYEEQSGSWGGNWRDEREASERLAAEAANRGVAWSLPDERVYWQASLNFFFAGKIFEEHRNMLGDQHPYLKQWLENQRAVFAKTSPELVDASAQHTGVAAALAADDYQYQLAALVFYAHSYTDAVERFRAIAAQPASRYRSIAAYMAARTLAQAGRVEDALAEIAAIEGNPELIDVHAIAQRLVGSIAWNGWWRLSRSVAQNDAPYHLLVANAQAMRRPVIELQSDLSKRTQYWQAVNDLAFFLRSDGSRAWMRRKFDDDWWLDPARAQQVEYWGPAVARVAAEDELIDWLQATEQVRELAGGPWLNYGSARITSSAFRSATEHVRKRAEESGKLIWLVADAMRSPRPADLFRPLYEIATKVANCSARPGELAALGALRYHAARREAINNRPYRRLAPRPEDIEEIAKLDPDARRETVRAMLPFTGGDTQLPKTGSAEIDWLLSASLDDLVATRADYDGDGQIAVINMMPARVLLNLASEERLAKGFRAALIRAAWTRAYLLDDRPLLDTATELLVKLNPGLSEAVAHYRDASTERERKGAALMLLVRTPRMQVFVPSQRDVGYPFWERMDGEPGKWSWHLSPAESAKDAINLFRTDDWNPNDGNWWCRPDVIRLQEKLERDFYDRPLGLAYDDGWYSYYVPQSHVAYSVGLLQQLDDRRRDFLSGHPVLKLIDWEELGKLSKIAAAPQYLTDELTAWIKDSSWLDRWWYGDEMAEALALTVRATRFGCHRDGSNRAYSHAAFSLLHEMFPDSEAAAHTRYWYD